jgi:hypothetical protein
MKERDKTEERRKENRRGNEEEIRGKEQKERTQERMKNGRKKSGVCVSKKKEAASFMCVKHDARVYLETCSVCTATCK